MKRAVLYIHGLGGSADEALHYKPLFSGCDVLGMDYRSQTPWEAQTEFPALFDKLCGRHASVRLIANSIGAFFAMHALQDKKIEKAFFISPVVDMEKLIMDMMARAGVTEEQLRAKREIRTASGQALSVRWLDYVRKNPVEWRIPTAVLYGEKDTLTSFGTISAFAEKTGASLTVMRGGEHWFHTAEQTAFLDSWIQ